MLGFVKETNAAALALDYKLGFKYVTRIPEVFRDCDLLVLAMDRADCKWLKLKPRSLAFTG